MNRREITEKTERLIRMLTEEKLDGILINSQPNFAWLTAGANNGIDQSRENGAASLLVRRDGKRFVLASRIEMPRILAEQVSEQDFEPIEFAWEEEKAVPDFLTKRAAALSNEGDALGSDLTLGANARIIEGAVARCRYSLMEEDIERYRKFGKDAGEAISELMKSLVPGESEISIAERARQTLAERRIQSVVTLVAADERLQKFRHPVPTEKSWEKVLMVVVCARRNGLIVSLSRIVCAGTIPGELRRKTDAAARVNAKLLSETKPGTTGAQFYQAAASAYAGEGFESEIDLHHQGGATGYRTRDWVAHPFSGESAQVNQAFAWNPSISGTKTEETCIAAADGIEVITASPNWKQITVEVNGREYLSPDILSL